MNLYLVALIAGISCAFSTGVGRVNISIFWYCKLDIASLACS
jgi:hypothetical protein